MSELNIILPCCFGSYCEYNSGLADGYVLGIITIIMIYIFIEIITNISEMYAFNDISEEKPKENKKEN
jgi:hypothetical protein